MLRTLNTLLTYFHTYLLLQPDPAHPVALGRGPTRCSFNDFVLARSVHIFIQYFLLPTNYLRTWLSKYLCLKLSVNSTQLKNITITNPYVSADSCHCWTTRTILKNFSIVQRTGKILSTMSSVQGVGVQWDARLSYCWSSCTECAALESRTLRILRPRNPSQSGQRASLWIVFMKILINANNLQVTSYKACLATHNKQLIWVTWTSVNYI